MKGIYANSITENVDLLPIVLYNIEADIPYSTLMTLLSRDIGGASFDVVMKICEKLEVEPIEIFNENPHYFLILPFDFF